MSDGQAICVPLAIRPPRRARSPVAAVETPLRGDPINHQENSQPDDHSISAHLTIELLLLLSMTCEGVSSPGYTFTHNWLAHSQITRIHSTFGIKTIKLLTELCQLATTIAGCRPFPHLHGLQR